MTDKEKSLSKEVARMARLVLELKQTIRERDQEIERLRSEYRRRANTEGEQG